MPLVEFEPTIPASERAKTVHVLDRAATVTGFQLLQLVTTSMDYVVTLLHTSLITIGHTRSSQSVTVLTSRCSVAAFHSGRSPSSGFPKCPRSQLPTSHSNSSQRLNPSGCLTATANWLCLSRHGPLRKHRSSVAVHLLLIGGMTCDIVACAVIGTYRAENTVPLLLLTNHYLATAVVLLRILRSLRSNGSTCHDIISALS
jgi:hypothetical protein